VTASNVSLIARRRVSVLPRNSIAKPVVIATIATTANTRVAAAAAAVATAVTKITSMLVYAGWTKMVMETVHLQ